MSSKHYVVLEGLGEGRSAYEIQATGAIEQSSTRLGGLPVSEQSGDEVQGSTATGHVSTGNDGFRIYGGIKEIKLENPDVVQVHVGAIKGGPNPSGDYCEVVVRAEEVKFLEGQGAGEGALELDIEHDIRGGQSSQSNGVKLPTGSTVQLGDSIDNFKIPRGGSETQLVTTKVTEREPGMDWFTGSPDSGSASKEITLDCSGQKRFSIEVPIDSDRGNPGRVEVFYTVDQQIE